MLTDGQTGSRTDITKLRVVFGNSPNSPTRRNVVRKLNWKDFLGETYKLSCIELQI